MTDIKKSIFKHDPIGQMKDEHTHFQKRKKEKEEKFARVKKLCKDYAKMHDLTYKFTFYISGIKTRVKHHKLTYGIKVFEVNESGFSEKNNLQSYYKNLLWEKVYLYLLNNDLIKDEE